MLDFHVLKEVKSLYNFRMRTYSTVLIFICLLICYVPGFARDEVAKGELVSDGKRRTFFVFVPENAGREELAPLLMLLHGSGRSGDVLIEHWKKIAKKEGIILAGPNATSSSGWSVPDDAPRFIYDLSEHLRSKHSIDPRRIYLFGHSAGAVMALMLSLLESAYFAATAVSAGALRSDDDDLFNEATRKVPVAIFVGTMDRFFPLSAVRQTRDAFKQRGFEVELFEVPNLDHNYYSRSEEINKQAWMFLQRHQLPDLPKYKEHHFRTE
jgi:poly(3-hydroxybutyrate) depolymerase